MLVTKARHEGGYGLGNYFRIETHFHKAWKSESQHFQVVFSFWKLEFCRVSNFWEKIAIQIEPQIYHWKGFNFKYWKWTCTLPLNLGVRCYAKKKVKNQINHFTVNH